MARQQPFDLGRQVKLTLVGPYGQVELNKVTSFSCKPNIEKEEVRPLNEAPIRINVPNGWEGEFEVARFDSGLDDLYARMEGDFWDGGMIPFGTLYQEIYTRGATTPDTYMFENVSIALADAGKFEATKHIAQKLEFHASRRVKV